jgi:hypothetical protein
MHDTLSSLVERALAGTPRLLEFYLREHGGLPGAHANLELAENVSHLLAAALPRNADGVHSLINYFVNGDRRMVGGNTPAEFVMVCGIFSYGVCAVAHPAWREEAFSLLHHYARSPYRRIREGVMVAYQQLLDADPQPVLARLKALMLEGNYVQQCVAVTTLSEPRLLYHAETLSVALELQRLALEHVRNAPTADRKKEGFRALRRALGFTLSVITAAEPEQGFALMRECAAWNDPDITWILRENLKKKRLARFPQDTAVLSQMLA